MFDYIPPIFSVWSEVSETGSLQFSIPH